MPISRLNYTDRKRISRKDVRVVVHERVGKPPTFDVDLKLTGYSLPDEALVFLEAYRQTLWMRFPFGKVGSILPPSDRDLTEFEFGEGILFRVRVTSAADPIGKILAEADGIRGRASGQMDDERVPLLPVRPEDLDQLVWTVDFTDEPVLLINKTVGDWRSLAMSPMFRSLVCPAALREVLSRILLHENYPDLEDREDWKTRWLLFARSLPGTGEIPEEEEGKDRFEDWIDTVVKAFTRQQSLLDSFLRLWQQEGTR
ncbi:MAG: hypothetical protein N2255_00970 [Kiritimatiellae bacterium]|nr:hypothetical protein [Kiritimatiellia bacterium]